MAGVESSLAACLPASVYTSAAFFEHEAEALLSRAWTFVGFAHELPSPGDARPLSVGAKPLFLVRGGDGELRAFHNACRHRGARLIESPTNVGTGVQCPYHAWAYALDGRLTATPHFGGPRVSAPEGFDPSAHGLVPARVAIWHDWVFVDLSGEAPAFEDYAAPLARRLADIDLDALAPVATLDFGEVACNWKVLVENFIEPYHVPSVHGTTTEQPLKHHYTILDGPCLGCAVELPPTRRPRGGNTLAVSSRYLTLFPNFVLGAYADQLGVHLNEPLGAGATRQRRVIYGYGEAPMEAQTIEALKELWTSVHKEDHAICEAVQAGRASPAAADGGVLSPHWENSVRRFQELVRDACGRP